jgi:hypothetical protein
MYFEFDETREGSNIVLGFEVPKGTAMFSNKICNLGLALGIFNAARMGRNCSGHEHK